MRKFVDTIVLVFLLIGPAVILTCVRQPTEEQEQYSQEEMIDDQEEDADMLVWNADFPRP